MGEFITVVEANPDVLRTFIICITVILVLLFFTIGAKLKLFSSLSIGKNGLDVKAVEIKATEIVKKIESEKEIKQFESGNLNKLLDDQIAKYDVELIDFALEQSNKLRRTLNIELNRQVPCSSTRRSLAACLRYPLYEASRKNNFKEVLRPENSGEYLKKLLREVKEEYQAFAIEMEMSSCAIASTPTKCPDLPPLDLIMDMLKDRLITNWMLPIRGKNIEICGKKYDKYDEYIPLYEELHDNNRVKVAKFCKGKNVSHIEGLSRKPEPGEF